MDLPTTLRHFRQDPKDFRRVVLTRCGALRLYDRVRSLGRPDALFVWIPKVAGTSVFRTLEGLGCVKRKTAESVKQRFPQRGLVTFGHMSYAELVDSGLVARSFDRGSFKFAFCRNPYDRAVSLYLYLRRESLIDAAWDFTAFLRDLSARDLEPIGLYNRRGLSLCNPQVRWIEALDLDFIGRFERIDRDFLAVMSRLGLPARPLLRLNATERAVGDPLYTPEARDIVEHVYAEDFSHFGYARDPFRAVTEGDE